MRLTTALARTFIAVSRWKVVHGDMPERVVLIGAPHTSYLDGVLMAVSLWSAGRDFRFLVKDSAANAPVVGPIVRAVGGIPVERTASHGLVEQMTERFASGDPFILCIAPKGTRGRREYWKSGFYRIAMAADVPIQLGFIDSSTRTFGWGGTYRLTGDVRRDMDVIRGFYAGKRGIHAELGSAPRLRAEDEAVAD